MGNDPTAEATEVEWQFDALDLRPVERWLAALPSRAANDGLPTLTALAKPPRRLVDRYLDTQDRRVGQAGLVLRIRRRGRSLEVTMKDTRPAGAGGLRQRLEVTEAVPPGGLRELGTEGPVGRRLSAVAGSRPLVDLLEVRTRRQPFSLRAAGAEVAEIALDDTTIIVGSGQRPVQLRRVEVEVVPEWLDALAPVVDELRSATGLRPATLSKFEAGLLAAGIGAPGPPDLGPSDVGPASTVGDLAFAVLRRHLRVLLAKEPGTRLGDDIEELHDMRVATRRLRAAIDLFAGALPARAQALREELRWLAAELGAVRDLDVQLERMDVMTQWAVGWEEAGHRPPLDHLRALLDAERAAARRDLLCALDSPRWARLADALVAMARQGPNRRLPAVRIPAAMAVPALVSDRHRAVTSAARRARRTGIAADYHRLRIRCKRLRYSLEFTSGLYGTGTQPFIRKLTRLQDALGLMQDAEVASTRLFVLATGSPESGELPASTVFVMGAAAEHYRRESDELRLSMSGHLGFVSGRAWDRLAGLMERASKRAAATSASTEPGRRTAAPAGAARRAGAPAAAASAVGGVAAERLPGTAGGDAGEPVEAGAAVPEVATGDVPAGDPSVEDTPAPDGAIVDGHTTAPRDRSLDSAAAGRGTPPPGEVDNTHPA